MKEARTITNNHTTNTTRTNENDINNNNNHHYENVVGITRRVRPLHVVFVHMDLGIGGAEQLIIQLAQASKRAGHTVDIITSRCDPDHCFAQVKPSGGILYPHLHICGTWIPATLWNGKAKALCSTLRVAYLAWFTARKRSRADVYVLDVLPLPLWIWNWISSASLLFYCHFPDLLLLQQQQQQQQHRSSGSGTSHGSIIQRWYRKIMDQIEEYCMNYADLIAVNSKFTQQTVRTTFPSLQNKELHVLYPALDTVSLDYGNPQDKVQYNDDDDDHHKPMIVSLNRYERKKNLELVLGAAAWYKTNCCSTKNELMPRIVIAGGYDLQCRENVEYLQELQQLANETNIQVTFLKSITDTTRAALLKSATAVMYTPTNEHFGIVPLEVMYSETIVIAVKSGGPMETIVDGVCGYLCEPTSESFGRALQQVLEATPEQRQSMERAAKERVVKYFSEDRLMKEWQNLLSEAVHAGRRRQSKSWWSPKTFLHVVQALLTLLLYLSLTKLLATMRVEFFSSGNEKEL